MVYIRPTAVYKFSSVSTDPQQFHHIIMLLSADYKPCNITSNRAILPEKLICKNSHFPPMYTDFFNEKVGYFIVSGTASLNMKIFPIYPPSNSSNLHDITPSLSMPFLQNLSNHCRDICNPSYPISSNRFSSTPLAHQAAITHYSLRRFPFP